jgi:hypothetical protein
MIAITDNRTEFVIAVIRRHSMDVATWRETSIAELRPSLANRVQLRDGESVLVSFSGSETDWYVLTSQRVLGVSGGDAYDVSVDAIRDYELDQFKLPDGQYGTFDLRLILADGSKVKVRCEAGKASMAPIYFVRTFHQLRRRAEQGHAGDVRNARA